MDELQEIMRRVEEGMEPEDAEAVKLARYGFGMPQAADPFDGQMVGLVRGAKNQEGDDRYEAQKSQGKARKLLKKLFAAHHSQYGDPYKNPSDLDEERTKATEK